MWVFDPALVRVQRGRLDQSSLPAKDTARAGLLQIPVAQFGDSNALTGSTALGSRIFAARRRGKLLTLQIAGLIGSEYAMLT